MRKWLIGVGVVVAVLLIMFGVVVVMFFQDQSTSYTTSQIYLTKDVCEQATGRECDLVMCDYIPEGKTFAEVCGKGFQPHWIPIQNQQTSSNTTATDLGVQSNVAATNKLLATPGQMVIVKGFAIFATTSCSFRTHENNSLPGLGAPCARDSGYAILSDKPLQQSRELDPTQNVTTLKNTEVLVFNVPDDVVAGMQLGDFYEFSGETASYNGQPGVHYKLQ